MIFLDSGAYDTAQWSRKCVVRITRPFAALRATQLSGSTPHNSVWLILLPRRSFMR